MKMKEISYSDFCSFIKLNIVDNEDAERVIIKYLLDDFKGTTNEKVYSRVETSALINDNENLFIPNVNIYVNLRRLTVLILACICDIFLTKGVITALGVALGKINPCIYKLKQKDCCIFSRVLFYSTVSNGISTEDLIKEFDGKCYGKGKIRCKSYINCGCRMSSLETFCRINDLKTSGVFSEVNGKLIVK